MTLLKVARVVFRLPHGTSSSGAPGGGLVTTKNKPSSGLGVLTVPREPRGRRRGFWNTLGSAAMKVNRRNSGRPGELLLPADHLLESFRV